MIIPNLSRIKTSQYSKAALSGYHGRWGEKYGNPEIVDEWHTCHMCRETVGTVLFAFNSIFH